MATALMSSVTGRKVRKEVGMTGEITLRGKVLPIGGLKEKVLAAHRAGVKRIVIPEENEKYLEEIPSFIRKDLKFIPVSHIEEVFRVALYPDGRRAASRGKPAGAATAAKPAARKTVKPALKKAASRGAAKAAKKKPRPSARKSGRSGAGRSS